MSNLMISVLILTKNEEHDLPSCLNSLSWCDDVHVFDSFSTDNTISVAEKYKVNIHQRVFDGYASQRNAALTTIEFKYDWIFIVDADERIPESLPLLLNEEIKAAENTNIAGFRIMRKDFLFDTWLKHAQITPWYIRLVKRGKARYHREINEVIEVDGIVKDIPLYFYHYPFSKGFTHWLHKHNVYSTMEAQRWIDEHKGNMHFSFFKALFSKDFSEKRYHQKGIFYKIPGRPLIKWLYMMFVRGSFLDGKAGVIYATLQSIYEYFIVIKTKELIKK